MANLEKPAANYRSEGYSALLAEARVCQDIALPSYGAMDNWGGAKAITVEW